MRASHVPAQALMSNASMMDDFAYSDHSDSDDEGNSRHVATTQVSDSGAGSASFLVERLATIESDNKPHKVTVAMLNFQPQFLYFCTPSLEQQCYLQVKAVNSSNFPILASEKAAVFFDGNFVTT